MAYDPIPFVDAAGVAVWSAKVAGDSNNRAQITADGQMSWGPGNAAVDTFMSRSGVATVAFGEVDGAGPHTVLVYNTRSASGANYERISLQYAANTAYLREQQAGTGVARNLFIGTQGASTLRLITSNTGRWDIGATGHWTAVSDNAFDAGGAANRIRSIYWGTQLLGPNGTAANPSWSFASETDKGIFSRAANSIDFVNSTSIVMNLTNDSSNFAMTLDGRGWFGFSPASPGAAAADTILRRDGAANTLAQRNGVNTQTFRVYNTYDGTNNEWLSLEANAGETRILQNLSGTGTARQLTIGTQVNESVVIRTNSINRWVYQGAGHLVSNSDNAYDQGSGSNRIRSIYWGMQALGPDGTAAAPAYGFAASGQTDVGIFRSATDSIGFAVGGAERFRIDGNVRISGGDSIVWNSAGSAFGGTDDLFLARDAANTLKQENANNVQAYRLGAGNGAFGNIRTATVLLSGLTGASVTATNFIPAGSFLIGVSVRVTTTITGATTFDIGDGADVDRWGAAIALAVGTTTNKTDETAAGDGSFAAANNVVLTANGSSFTAGAVRLTITYLDLTAPTS